MSKTHNYSNYLLSSYKHLNISERKFSIDVDANDTVDQLVLFLFII